MTLISMCLALLVILAIAVVLARKPKHRAPMSFLFANTVTVEELRERLNALTAQARAIQETADRESRPLSKEEETEIESCLAAFDATELEIKRRERLAAAESRLNAPGARRTEAAPVAVVAQPEPQRAPITGGDKPGASKGTSGFMSMGEFGRCVKAAVGGHVDPRLRVLSAAADPMKEGSGSEGGYLIPVDFRNTIMQKVFGEDSLLSRTDQQSTNSTSITFPVDETTPWQTAGGVQVYWEGEGAPIGQSKIALNTTTVRAHKIAALVGVTDELLDDAASLTAYLNRKVPEKLQYKVNDALLNGDGVGKPKGILNSACKVAVAAEGGQAVDTILFMNIEKMWSRMYAPCRRNAVWVANQDIEPQLSALVHPDAAKTGGFFPAYMPANGMVANAPNGSLKGRPIVYTEAAAALGDEGDLSLVDFSQYLSLIKSGGVKQDVSIHLWFDQGITAFRYTLRIGGQCWWSSAIARAKSANPLSCVVTLAAR